MATLQRKAKNLNLNKCLKPKLLPAYCDRYMQFHTKHTISINTVKSMLHHGIPNITHSGTTVEHLITKGTSRGQISSEARQCSIQTSLE